MLGEPASLISLFSPLRCHLPSGKYLWLCRNHQKLPRVTVISDDMEEIDQSGIDAATPEYQLLTQLRELMDSADVDNTLTPKGR